VQPAVMLPPQAGYAWAEIDLDAIAANVTWVRSLLRRGTRFAAVLKADAYGHGAVEIAKAVWRAGADLLAVTSLEEGLELRLEGVDAPILVMGRVHPSQAESVVRNRLEVCVYDPITIRALSGAAARTGLEARLHLKIDTGLARYGVSPNQAVPLMQSVQGLPALVWDGIGTHLARAFDPAHPATGRQFRRFRDTIDALKNAGFTFPYQHIANSSALLAHPELQMNMVRIGNLLYGLEPFPTPRGSDGPRPAFRLFARLTQVRCLERGDTAGYGAEFVARRRTVVGVVPVGFSDGWGVEPLSSAYQPRNVAKAVLRRMARGVGLGLGSLRTPNGGVELDGVELPVLGRPAMQQVVVDLSRVPGAAVGDVVLLHCRPPLIGRRVPRLYIRQGEAMRIRTLFGSLDWGAAAADAAGARN